MDAVQESVSIYCAGNPWGYRYNINHPKIRELMQRYRVWKGIAMRPMTDAERLDFENYLDGMVKKA